MQDGFDHEMGEPSEQSIEGAAAEVIADFETKKVVTRFFDTEGGGMEQVMELHLDPEVAREYAFNLTRASLAIEG